MMLKLLPLTALALGLSSGVALADHRGGDHRGDRRAVVEHRAPVVVRDHGHDGHRGGEWRGRTFVREGRGWHGGGRCGFPPGRSPARWTPRPRPGWNRR